MVGILVGILARPGSVIFDMPTLSLEVTTKLVLLMARLILYATSNIIYSGETNNIMVTVTLLVTIFNLFTSLLNLHGFANGKV